MSITINKQTNKTLQLMSSYFNHGILEGDIYAPEKYSFLQYLCNLSTNMLAETENSFQ